MATAEEITERFTALRDAVNKWADKTKKRLNDEAAFLKSIQGSTKQLTNDTSSVEADLAFRDVTDFLSS